MASKLCPECLSSVDSAATECSACGARLDRPRRGSRGIGLFAVVVALGCAAVSYALWRGNAETDGSRAGTTETTEVAPETEASDGADVAGSAHVWLRPAEAPGGTWPALAITGDGPRPALLLALDGLPLRGGLHRVEASPDPVERPLQVRVLTYSVPLGLVLLDPTELPQTVIPVAAGGDLVGRLEALREGAGGTGAGSLSPLLAALATPRPRPLDLVQEELRQWLPERLGPEVDRLLKGPDGPEAILKALDILARMRPRLTAARDLEHLERRERRAFQLLVRAHLPHDRAEALTRAREGLTRYPDHHGLLADAVTLVLAMDDTAEALQLYGQLRGASPTHANSIAEAVGSALLRAAERRASKGRLAEAADVLTGAQGLFPNREDIREAYLRVVSLAERAAQPVRRVEIPIDPRTKSIRTEVVVAGRAMEFVVDTGATYTTLPESMVRALGLIPQGRKVTVETASGILEVDVVEVPWVTIGPLRVEKVRALVLDLPGSLGGKGLLGLNVLRQLNMEIDSNANKLILKGPTRTGR